MANFNSNITARLEAFKNRMLTEVKEAVEVNIGDMGLQAIRDAPGGGDMIATENGQESLNDIRGQRNWTPISQAIGYSITENGYKGTLYVEQSAGEVAAWVEFGTGQSASRYLSTVPPEWRETAQRYYINGRGTIINKPYIWPAYMKYREEFVKDLKKAIANIRL